MTDDFFAMAAIVYNHPETSAMLSLLAFYGVPAQDGPP